MKMHVCRLPVLAAFAVALAASPAAAIAPVSPPTAWVEQWVADFEDLPGKDVFGEWNNRNGSGVVVQYDSGGTAVVGAQSLPGFGSYYLYSSTVDPTLFSFSGLGAPIGPDQQLKLQFDLAFLDYRGATGDSSYIDVFLNGMTARLYPTPELSGGELVGDGSFAWQRNPDAVYHYELLLPYVDEFLSLGFQVGGPGTGSSGVARWGIDNIRLSTAAAIPEPATWMLLIAGFGFIGLAMRRKQRIGVASN